VQGQEIAEQRLLPQGVLAVKAGGLHAAGLRGPAARQAARENAPARQPAQRRARVLGAVACMARQRSLLMSSQRYRKTVPGFLPDSPQLHWFDI